MRNSFYPLREEFEKTGNWLFKNRSYFPFLILPLLFVALRHSERLESFGNTVQTAWEVFCIVLSFSGYLIRCITIGWIFEGTSGRNTKGQLAKKLNTQGMYSIVRHPLYLGNFLITLGFILFVEVGWLVGMAVLLFWLYYERIMFAEEEFLRREFGEAYIRWASQTPAFIPSFRKWKRAPSSFSLRMILRREYSGFLGIITGFVALKFFAELLGEGELVFRKLWIVFLCLGLLVYFVLRTLRKHTNLLAVKGR